MLHLLPCRDRLVSRRVSFIADQRGAAALEMLVVFLFLGVGLLLPLADVAAAGFRFVSAWEALRAFGQKIQYAPPPDVTDWAAWKAALPTSVSGYPINDLQVVCSDTMAACSATNFLSPKHYTYTTTVTVEPIVLRAVICRSGNGNPCSFTLSYGERFQ
ncbi:hypothetical protein [Bradyrhizobium sp. AUGA SZCCT0431]|uniref:hypothetical protein n=1 Tax=Bradyrhizobium sp. AUGA SZCCT0431 TaxID=2807674 RepID=UPI00289C1EF3|nr:hypothetical protein [Bradyrhizobium sp. AUGA SZCCT0431]